MNEENGERRGEAYEKALAGKTGTHVAAIEMDGGAEKPVGFGYGSPGRRRATPNPPQTGPELSEAEMHSLEHVGPRAKARCYSEL